MYAKVVLPRVLTGFGSGELIPLLLGPDQLNGAEKSVSGDADTIHRLAVVHRPPWVQLFSRALSGQNDDFDPCRVRSKHETSELCKEVPDGRSGVRRRCVRPVELAPDHWVALSATVVAHAAAGLIVLAEPLAPA